MTSSVEWATAAEPLRGQLESGDGCAVLPFAGGVTIAAIDGLGHGPEAAAAARTAIAALAACPELPVDEQLRRCHAALNGTRGAVMTVAAIAAGRLAWAGVGNVEGWLLRASPGSPRESPPLRGGVVGYNLPKISVSHHAIAAGDTLVLATDGVRVVPSELPFLGVPCALAARALLDRFATGTDDALVLVARALP